MRKQPEQMGDLLQQVLVGTKIGQGLDEMHAVAACYELLGDAISVYIKEAVVKNGTLYLRLNSAPLRHELFMSRDKLIKQINEKLGVRVLHDINLR